MNKVLLLNIILGSIAFVIAAYLGANIAIALSCGFLTACVVNVTAATINLNKIGR